MAAINYKTYTIDASGFAEFIADITAMYKWTKVETVSDTEMKFYTETGAAIKADLTGNLNMAAVLPDGTETHSYVCNTCGFLSTDKVVVMFAFRSTGTVAQTAASVWRAFAISTGTDVATDNKQSGIISIFGDSNSGACYGHICKNTSATLTQSSYTGYTNAVTCFAVAGHCKTSNVIADNILLVLTTPFSSMLISNDITVDGKKYFQAGMYLIAE